MTANWIWISHDTLSAIDTYVLFRKQLKCDAKRPVLRLSAVTNFELRVNGVLLPGSQFSDLTECPTYTDFDLRKAWKKGKNLVEVIVYSIGRSCFTATIHQPGLWAELRDGRMVLDATDATWEAALSPAYRSGKGVHTTGQLGDAFSYDARKTRPEWQHAVIVDGPAPTLRPLPPLAEQPARPVRVVQAGTLLRHCEDPGVSAARLVTSDFLLPDFLDARYVASDAKDTQRFLWGCPLGLRLAPDNAERLPLQFQPLKTPEFSLSCGVPPEHAPADSPANGWYLIVDLGEETTGWLTFTIQATEGTVLDIAHGEHLDDGRVRSFIHGRNFADRYICHDGLNTFTHRLRRLGARYLEMHVTEANEPPRVGYLGLLPVFRNLPTPDTFRTEDSALAFGAENIIWACYSRAWWFNQVLTDEGEKTQQYDKLKQVNAEIHALAPEYMRYRNVSTHFLGFLQNSETLVKLQDTPVLESLSTGVFTELKSDLGYGIIVGQMESRTKDGSAALFICAADDPLDAHPTQFPVTFRCDGFQVTAHGSLLEQNQDGSYTLTMNSCGGALLIAK